MGWIVPGQYANLSKRIRRQADVGVIAKANFGDAGVFLRPGNGVP